MRVNGRTRAQGVSPRRATGSAARPRARWPWPWQARRATGRVRSVVCPRRPTPPRNAALRGRCPTARFCACRLRTRARWVPGTSCNSSPTFTVPACTVPVTTVPTPSSVNARSTARRKASAARACEPVSFAAWNRASFKAARPSPVWADTGNMVTPANGVGASKARTSSTTACTRALSARSHLVMATTPRAMPSSDSTARCSCVCGITPSSAATRSSAKSMPVAPASMVCTRRSWPGTSMKPMRAPSGASRKA